MEWMFLPLKRYAEFSGRSRRMEYWMFALFQFLLWMAFWVVLAVVGGAALMSGDVRALFTAGGMLMIVCAAFGLLWLAMLIPALAVGVRRLHDTGRTGWWLLAPAGGYVLSAAGESLASNGSAGAGSLLMGIGGLASLGFAVVLFVFMLLDGNPGPNRYGPNPKDPDHREVFA